MKISCARCRADLPQYLDEYGRNRPDSDVAAHLATCPDCTRELALLQSLRNETRAIGLASPPSQLRANVRAALEAEAHATRQRATTPRVAPLSFLSLLRRPAFTWSSGVALAAFALFATMREPMPPLVVPVATEKEVEEATAPTAEPRPANRVAKSTASKKPPAATNQTAADRSLPRAPATVSAPFARRNESEVRALRDRPSAPAMSSAPMVAEAPSKPPIPRSKAVRPEFSPRVTKRNPQPETPVGNSRDAVPPPSVPQTFATAINPAARGPKTTNGAIHQAGMDSNTTAQSVNEKSNAPLVARIALLPRENSVATKSMTIQNAPRAATEFRTDNEFAAKGMGGPSGPAGVPAPLASSSASATTQAGHESMARTRRAPESTDGALSAPSFPRRARGGGSAENSPAEGRFSNNAGAIADATQHSDAVDNRVATPPRAPMPSDLSQRRGAATYSAPFSLAVPQLALAAGETRRAMLVVTLSRDAKNVRLCVTRDGLEIGDDVLWRGDAQKGRDIVVPVSLRALRAGTVRAVISLETLDGTILASQTVEAFAAP